MTTILRPAAVIADSVVVRFEMGVVWDAATVSGAETPGRYSQTGGI